MKRGGSITNGAAERWLRYRFNPWSDMTPERLVAAFAEWDQGWLRRAALMWENRAEGDEVLAVNLPKRSGSVARLPWAVMPIDDSIDAARHAEALEDFFNRGITATDALDLDQRGGMRLLIEQMMEAAYIGKQAHEIIWTPGAMDLAAELRAVPLYFFESLSGRLRYTGPEMTTNGQPLEPGGWMITTRRRKLLKAALMCCLFKGMSYGDWVGYSGRFGQPGVHGETDAQPGTPEWEKAEEMVAAFAAEWAALTRTGTKINLIETGKNPNAPYEPLVERMSRILTMLCRGADLGTMSSQDGAGASLQGDESDILLDDDAQMISEALQHFVARPVIRHLFGTETPLAYIELQVPSDSDTKAEIAVDTALASMGLRQAPEDLAERYGRTIEVAPTLQAENDAAATEDEETMPALAALLRKAISMPQQQRLYNAIASLLTDREGDAEDLLEGLKRLRDRLPEYLGEDPEAELAFERFAAAATYGGWSGSGKNLPTESTGIAGPLRGLAAGSQGAGRPNGAENDIPPSAAISGAFPNYRLFQGIAGGTDPIRPRLRTTRAGIARALRKPLPRD